MARSRILALIVLLSSSYALEARYLTYQRALQVLAKLKTLHRHTDGIEHLLKELEQKYVGFLRPQEYNQIQELLLSCMNTSPVPPLNKREQALQVLEQVQDIVAGLINRYGYRAEFIDLEYEIRHLQQKIHNSFKIYPFDSRPWSGENRGIQDLLSRAVLHHEIFQEITKRIEPDTPPQDYPEDTH